LLLFRRSLDGPPDDHRNAGGRAGNRSQSR
jgi:hypothetical protein